MWDGDSSERQGVIHYTEPVPVSRDFMSTGCLE